MSGRLSDLSRAKRRRAVTLVILRIFGLWVVLFLGYYFVPVASFAGRHVVLVLIGGSALFMTLVVWQVSRIGRARLPTLQAVQALGLLIPFFLVLFASFYLSLAATAAESFSETLNHTDSLYFTVTVFATVGFGDITPRTSQARLLVSVQMLLDLVVLGGVVRIVTFAVRRKIDQ